MSELYMIVLQGKEELGNDPEAVRLWAELSGVDIDSIDENTPFDIDVADRLLKTLPEVIERMKRKATQEVEDLEEKLKKVLRGKEEKEDVSILEELKGELESSIFPIEEEEVKTESTEVQEVKEGEQEGEMVSYEVLSQPVDIPFAEVVRFAELEGRSLKVMKGSWPDDYDVYLAPLSSAKTLSFSAKLRDGNYLYGERVGERFLLGEFEVKNLAVAVVLFGRVVKALG